MGAQPAVSYVDQLESRIVNVDRQLAALEEDFKAGKIVVANMWKEGRIQSI
ncbi:MAG: hypothetical protein JSW72_09230 [Candidatus Bathyarchaeota archaeon]|nr:MAG: hypothetical protein JSW72_09230 [Candidatus Bathyarchaeota archaeon]